MNRSSVMKWYDICFLFSITRHMSVLIIRRVNIFRWYVVNIQVVKNVANVRPCRELARRTAQTYRLLFAIAQTENYVADLGTAVFKIACELVERLTREANVKWYLSLSLVFHKATLTDVVTDPPVYSQTKTITSTSTQPIELQLKVSLRRLWQKIDTFEENGSGWVVDRLTELDLHLVSYDPLCAGIYCAGIYAVCCAEQSQHQRRRLVS